MENSHLSEHLANKENVQRFQQTTLLLEVASLIYSTMKKKNISCGKLAKDLGVTKGRISQYLGGERNLRLRTLADIFTALECKLQISAEDNSAAAWHLITQDNPVSLTAPKWN